MKETCLRRELCDIAVALLVLLGGVAVAPLTGIATSRIAAMASVSAGALFLTIVLAAMLIFVGGEPSTRSWRTR